jgi:hypothetical protein
MVSDITWIRLITGFVYLGLITVAYLHKIAGYSLHKALSAEGRFNAL